MNWPWSRQSAVDLEQSKHELETMLERLAGTDFGRGLAAEAREERARGRVALRAEIDTGRAEHVHSVEALRATERDARAEVDRAQAGLEVARRALAVATGAITTESLAGLRHERLERRLRATADVEIALFVAWLDREEAQLCALRPRAIVETRLGGLLRTVETDGDAIPRALVALRAAREAAHALELEILTPEALQGRLAALREPYTTALAKVGVLERVGEEVAA